jgi:methionine-rich copper-binding protein CopC
VVLEGAVCASTAAVHHRNAFGWVDRMKPSLLCSIAILSLTASASEARVELVESLPADNAVLYAPPYEIVLTFSEDVTLTSVSIQKNGGATDPIESLPQQTDRQFTLEIPMLAAGHYLVSWSAVDEDTGAVTGRFSFLLHGVRSDF